MAQAGRAGAVATAGAGATAGVGATAGAGGGAIAGGGGAIAGASGSAGEGNVPTAPWSADHETESLSEWLGDGFGWEFSTWNGSVEISSERARTGQYALKSTLSSTDAREQAVVGRYVNLTEGYYSAWFYVPSQPEATGRVIFKLSAYDPDQDVFDITMVPKAAGGLGLTLYSHEEGRWISDPEAVPAVPLDTWFEVEAFYRSSPEPDGRVVVWQDGALVIDTGPRVTGPNERVMLVVGSVGAGSELGPVSLYVDSVRIGAGR